MNQVDEPTLVAAARQHDRAAFDQLVRTHMRRLRAVIRRMIGHPDDTDELVQEALLKAWRGIADYRGEAAFGTWLCSIGMRTAVDHLRGQRRWRPRNQVAYANECAKSDDLAGEIGAALYSADFQYQAREHIAYCFTCVGRSLAPKDQAAIVLAEVMGFSNKEAADALNLSQGTYRGRLKRARTTMTETYEGLCALVNKQGVCYQCKGLRDAAPEGAKGQPAPEQVPFSERLSIVRDSDVDTGQAQALHDACWRGTKRVEDAGRGDVEPETDCGQ